MEVYTSIIGALNNFLYQPYVVPLFLLAAGLFFTFRSKFIQFRPFGEYASYSFL